MRRWGMRRNMSWEHAAPQNMMGEKPQWCLNTRAMGWSSRNKASRLVLLLLWSTEATHHATTGGSWDPVLVLLPWGKARQEKLRLAPTDLRSCTRRVMGSAIPSTPSSFPHALSPSFPRSLHQHVFVAVRHRATGWNKECLKHVGKKTANQCVALN